MIKGKPFVKWAGGKRQIIDKLKSLVPDEFDTYYEPFVGGGALLFELSPKRAVINEEYPSKELIKDTIRKYIPDMSEETVNRRASTIRGWIQWIIGAQI